MEVKLLKVSKKILKRIREQRKARRYFKKIIGGKTFHLMWRMDTKPDAQRYVNGFKDKFYVRIFKEPWYRITKAGVVTKSYKWCVYVRRK